MYESHLNLKINLRTHGQGKTEVFFIYSEKQKTCPVDIYINSIFILA